jgi:hypothetical protein
MHKLHRWELKAEDLLDASLSVVRKPHERQHLHLHRKKVFGVQRVLLGRVVVIDVALDAQEQVVLEDAPQL